LERKRRFKRIQFFGDIALWTHN